jgi:hypothetical protein
MMAHVRIRTFIFLAVKPVFPEQSSALLSLGQKDAGEKQHQSVVSSVGGQTT